MKRHIARGISHVVIKHPYITALVLVVLTAFSAWRVSKLHINNDQIELIPQNLPSVVATKEMIKMVGGVGFLQLAIKGDNLVHLKGVADDLAVDLQKIDQVRNVTYKQDVQFV